MAYKSIEKRRAKGREAQARYRRRHPDRTRAASNSDKSRAARRAWRARNVEKVRRYSREGQRRKRQAERMAGMSPALDRMRADLKACFDPATRARLIEAIEHMEKVIMGGKVKPRDPRRVVLAPLRTIKFNARLVPAATPDDGGATGKAVGSWMDEKLPPETG